MDLSPMDLVECRYMLRKCDKRAIEGYQFCRTHILEDKNSPYQPCTYVSTKTGRRCAFAAIKTTKKESYCSVHIEKINRSLRLAAKRHFAAQQESPESILEELEHYSTRLYNNNRGDKIFVRNETNSLADLGSSSESDHDDKLPISLSHYCPESDSESVDSENEDIFKYAQNFTEEEVVRITRDKHIKLQSLYIEQFKWLQYVLRERRRKFVIKRASEKEESSHISESMEESQCGVSSKEVDKRIQLGNDKHSQQYIALRRHHKRHGQEALMYLKSQERRKSSGDHPVNEGAGHYNRYRYATKHGTKHCSAKHVRCSERSLPFTRYCAKHIGQDSRQVLYKRCGFKAVEGGLSCERVVPFISGFVRCDYHMNINDLQAGQPELSENRRESLQELEVVDEKHFIQPEAVIETSDFPI